MEKLYLLLPWLDMDQALDLLQIQTGTAVTSSHLWQMCNARECDAYVRVDGLVGRNLVDQKEHELSGVHRLCMPTELCEPPYGGFAWGVTTQTGYSDGEALSRWYIEQFPISVPRPVTK